MEDILQEVRDLAANGYQEVVLTGIHLDSYGTDLEGTSLLAVVQEVAKIEGIRRIRLGSLEPRIMTEEFVRGLAAEEKLCPHFHLSLQSGCDETLKRMNRRYTADEFRDCCGRLRRYFDHPALTTDVIVGFPGETEEEFRTTVKFLEEICFYETHVFKFSRRRGTRADRMPGQIPERVKNERSDVLLKMTEENSRRYRELLIGSTVEVLMEEECVFQGKNWQTGHTAQYVRIAVPGTESLANRMVRIQVEGFLEPDVLYGKIMETQARV